MDSALHAVSANTGWTYMPTPDAGTDCAYIIEECQWVNPAYPLLAPEEPWGWLNEHGQAEDATLFKE